MVGRPSLAAKLKAGPEARPTNIFWFPSSCLGTIFLSKHSFPIENRIYSSNLQLLDIAFF